MVKVALIGCGGWGKNLARVLHDLGALGLIVDPADQARNLASTYGTRHSDSFNDALLDPDIGALVLATPAETHFELASRAMDAGKDVYVEKPIALSTEEGRRLEKQAATRGRILMVGHLLQYHPVYRKLKGQIDDGALGKLRHITSNRLNLGMLRSEENVMWSFAPHDVSMVLGITGIAPARVTCIGSSFFQPGIADITTLHMEFPDGVTADVRSSWFNPEKEQKLIVVGDAAMAVFSDTVPWDEKLQIQRFEIDGSGVRPRAIGEKHQKVDVDFGEPLKLEMQHFLDCVADRQKPLTDAVEANGVLAVLQAAQSSLENGGVWTNV
jgi:UDP-2-acetamido-3-amino-2,3-dideoxy-glucuronate N-acetyltransferase